MGRNHGGGGGQAYREKDKRRERDYERREEETIRRRRDREDREKARERREEDRKREGSYGGGGGGNGGRGGDRQTGGSGGKGKGPSRAPQNSSSRPKPGPSKGGRASGPTKNPYKESTGDFRRRTGRCLTCGEQDHKKALCPVSLLQSQKDKAKVTSTATGNASTGPAPVHQPNQAPAVPAAPPGVVSTGPGKGKRNRSGTSSTTSPPKKIQKLNTSQKQVKYAAVAAGAASFVVLNKDGTHIREAVFHKLQAFLEADYLEKIEKRQFNLLPVVESWTYTNTMCAIYVQDTRSVDLVAPMIGDQGFLLVDRKEFVEKRRPTKFFTALVKGVGAQHSIGQLKQLVQAQQIVKRISGLIEVLSVNPVQKSGGKNAILRLKVDDIAEKDLMAVDNTLQLGMSGKVLLVEQKTSSSTKVKAPVPTPLEEVQLKLAAELESFERKKQELLARQKELEEEEELKSATNSMANLANNSSTTTNTASAAAVETEPEIIRAAPETNEESKELLDEAESLLHCDENNVDMKDAAGEDDENLLESEDEGDGDSGLTVYRNGDKSPEQDESEEETEENQTGAPESSTQ